MSALDDAERQKAIAWTKATIDTAVHFKARVVVIHAGAVDFEDERSLTLKDLCAQGKTDSPEFRDEKLRILTMREEKRQPYLKVLEESLEEILTYAQAQDREVGFETRYYPLEIPNYEEIGHFLKLFQHKGLFYWHDMGHAQMNEKLGITPNLEFLRRYSDQLRGMHVHDMKGVRDHLAPFTGEIPFSDFFPFFKKCNLNVFEIKSASKEEMQTSLSTFKKYLD